MVAQQHYQRLKHLYAAASAESATGPVDISHGYAEIVGILDDTENPLVNRRSHHRLLADAASLAAGSVEKDGQLTMERFNLRLKQPGYRGPVRATAEVVLAEPPHYHVRSTLVGEDGEEIADALAFFVPNGEELPPDPAPEADEDTTTPPPAPFMPIHVTRYGALCLN